MSNTWTCTLRSLPLRVIFAWRAGIIFQNCHKVLPRRVSYVPVGGFDGTGLPTSRPAVTRSPFSNLALHPVAMHLGKFLVRSFPPELLRLVPNHCRELDLPFCQLLLSLVGVLGRMERQIVREVIAISVRGRRSSFFRLPRTLLGILLVVRIPSGT
jgi:hypothetical protein